jgi:hypothetical protein
MPGVDDAEIPPRLGLAGQVTGLLGGPQGSGEDRLGVQGVPVDPEVAGQDSSQRDGVAGPAVAGGVGGDGYQAGSFGIQPVPRCGRGGGGGTGRAGAGGCGRRCLSAGCKASIAPAAAWE